MSEDTTETETTPIPENNPAGEEARRVVKDSQELLKATVESKPGGQMRSQQVEAVDSISNALENKENLILEAPTGSGKALYVNTPILTTKGWKTMGTLTDEDEIYGTNGNIIKVLETHAPYQSDDLYEIKIENGDTFIADGPHLWPLYYDNGIEGDKEDIIAEVKADLSAVDALPAEMTVSSLMYMLPYVPHLTKKNFKEKYEDKDEKRNSAALLEDFYLFLRNDAGREIVTTSDLHKRHLAAEETNPIALASFTGTLQHGTTTLNPSKIARFAKKLARANYKDNHNLLDLTVDSKQQLLKEIVLEAGETNPNGTGYYYLTLLTPEARAQIQQMIASLGYKTITIEPSKRLLFQAQENLLEGTRQSSDWRMPYSSFYTNDRLNIEKITKLENDDRFVRCITVDSEDHLFLAGEHFIPTHNTLSYLIPTVFHQSRVVISTATKQLSEQIVKLDIPFVQEIVKEVSPAHAFTAALLKGRENYFCLSKQAEQSKIAEDEDNSLFGAEEVSSAPTSFKGKQIASESKQILEWADETETGDRTEAPPVSDETWAMFSSNSAECPGRGVCSFASQCFSEKAREAAKEADIVVTNHAVVANDLRADEAILLGERDSYIFDEMHELDHYLSDAWGVTLTAKMLKDSVRKFSMIKDVKDSEIEEYEKLGKKFNSLAEKFEPGLIESTVPVFESYMSQLYKITNTIAEKANKQATDKESNEGKKKQGSQVFKQSKQIADAALMLMNDNSEDIVRWISRNEDKRNKEITLTFHATLLRVGPELQQSLNERDATMIGTSATIRVAGSFEIPVHNLDLKKTGIPYKTKALSSPFEYRKQAMIYVPDPADFPAPDYKTRDLHSAAVRDTALELINAMGGRALMLHTTTFEMRRMGDFLKEKLEGKYTVLVQGDAPNQQLINEFKEDKTSVLVATMGMWHGLDVPGDALALVMMDKIPFTPMNDPLSKARQNWADNNGRSGFRDVYVAEANIMLAQGAGRLVRSITDKGIIAIFDTRLRTKSYAKSMTKSLPDAGYFMSKTKVIESAERLGKTFDA